MHSTVIRKDTSHSRIQWVTHAMVEPTGMGTSLNIKIIMWNFDILVQRRNKIEGQRGMEGERREFCLRV